MLLKSAPLISGKLSMVSEKNFFFREFYISNSAGIELRIRILGNFLYIKKKIHLWQAEFFSQDIFGEKVSKS